jgi:glutamine synthetase adenylyltransferase
MLSRDQLKKELSLLIRGTPDLETALDELRRFKKQKVEEIQKKDISGDWSLPEVFFALSYLADAVMSASLSLAGAGWKKTFGF